MQLPMRFEVAAGYATGLILALLLAAYVRAERSVGADTIHIMVCGMTATH